MSKRNEDVRPCEVCKVNSLHEVFTQKDKHLVDQQFATCCRCGLTTKKPMEEK